MDAITGFKPDMLSDTKFRVPFRLYLSPVLNGREQRVVVDGDVVSSAGGLTGCEGSLCLVGQLFGKAEADKIGLEFWSEQQECGRFAVKAPSTRVQVNKMP